MAHAEGNILIERPIGEVFDYLADGTNNTAWREGVLEIRHREDTPEGKGAIVLQTMKGPGGRKIAGDYEIVECVAPSTIRFQVIAGPARPKENFKLEAQAGATSLTFILDLVPRGFARLMAGMIERQMRSEVRSLATLKVVLERSR